MGDLKKIIENCNSKHIIFLIRETNLFENFPQQVQENFDIILDKCSPTYIEQMVKELKIQLPNALIDNFTDIIKKASPESITRILNTIEDMDGIKEQIDENEDFIMKKIKIEDLDIEGIILLMNKFKKPKTKELFNDKFDIIIKKMFDVGLEEIKDKTVLKFADILVREILNEQNKNITDLEYVGCGAYSMVYKIGDKILKVGDYRETHEIPYHPRILQPIFRREIPYLNKNETLLFIEITEEVDTNKISKEDVYKIYKELRDDGIVWLDPTRQNLGRLKKPNTIHYKQPSQVVDKQGNVLKTEENLYVEDSTLGITNVPKQKKILPKGELVILDTDYIYKEEELNQEDASLLSNNIFEKRYQTEKSGKTEHDEK